MEYEDFVCRWNYFQVENHVAWQVCLGMCPGLNRVSASRDF